MPKRVRSIEVYLPLDYSDGRPIEDSKFLQVQQELLTRFGGVTSTRRRFPLQGLWRSGGRVYQDRVVAFAVMDFRSRTELEALNYCERLKVRLMKRFDQLDVLITVQELWAV
jgi:hypothetical protein